MTTLKCVCPLKGGPITTQHAHVMPSRVIPQWGIRIMPQWDIIRDLNISDPRSPVSDIPPWGFNRGKTLVDMQPLNQRLYSAPQMWIIRKESSELNMT